MIRNQIMTKTFRHITVLGLAALATIAMAAPASAKPGQGKNKAKSYTIMAPSFLPSERTQVPQWAQQRISYSRAKSIARSRYPGAEVVDIALDGNTYRVRLVLQNRKIVDVLIDAASGRIR